LGALTAIPVTPLGFGHKLSVRNVSPKPPTDMSSPRHDADVPWLIEIWNRKGSWENRSTA